MSHYVEDAFPPGTTCKTRCLDCRASWEAFTRHSSFSRSLWTAPVCVYMQAHTHVCSWTSCSWELGPRFLPALWAWDRLLPYLIVILQHLSDDPYLRVVVLYGDDSEREENKAEPGSASPLESDGEINSDYIQMQWLWGQQPGPSEGLQAPGQVKLCFPHHIPWSCERKSQSSHRLCLRRKEERDPVGCRGDACVQFWHGGLGAAWTRAYCLPRHLNKASSTCGLNRFAISYP